MDGKVMKSRIPSPARSLGASRTPRRSRPRPASSVGSPRRTPRLSALARLRDEELDSFNLSPVLTQRSVLSDNTDIEEPRRKSWWKRLDDNNSREMMDVLGSELAEDVNNVIGDYADVEVFSQEKRDYLLDIPESSGSESIDSIVVPQRKLFTQKENQPVNRFGQLKITRESVAKLQKTNIEDKTVHVPSKKLFGQGPSRSKAYPALIHSPDKTGHNGSIVIEQRNLFKNVKTLKSKTYPSATDNKSPEKSPNIETKNLLKVRTERTKPLFPAELLSLSLNKTKDLKAEPKVQARSLFGNQPNSNRKNRFADFIMSESEEEIPDVEVEESEEEREPKVSSAAEDHEEEEEEEKEQNDSGDEQEMDHAAERDDEEIAGTPNVSYDPTATIRDPSNVKSPDAALAAVSSDDSVEGRRGNTSIRRTVLLRSSEPRLSIPSLRESGGESIQGSGWDFGKDFSPRKSLQALVMDKTANRQTLANVMHSTAVSEAGDMEATSVASVGDLVDDGDMADSGDMAYDGDMTSDGDASPNVSTLANVMHSTAVPEAGDMEATSVASVGDLVDDGDMADSGDMAYDGDMTSDGDASPNVSRRTRQATPEMFLQEVKKSKTYPSATDNKSPEKSPNIEPKNLLKVRTERTKPLFPAELLSLSLNKTKDLKTEPKVQARSLFGNQPNSNRKNRFADFIMSESKEEIPDVEVEESEEEREPKVPSAAEDHEEEEEEEKEQNDSGDEQEMDHAAERDDEEIAGTPNVSYDPTATIRDPFNVKSPEAALAAVSRHDSVEGRRRNTSIRRTVLLRSSEPRLSIPSLRESGGESSQGSGWDSHRTTKKTLRQTFGKDFSPRKSLRALVMEKTANRQTSANVMQSTAVPEAGDMEATSVASVGDLVDDGDMADSGDMAYDGDMTSEGDASPNVSRRTRQATLEMFLQEVKKKTIQRKRQMEDEIRSSLKEPPQETFKLPLRPAPRRLRGAGAAGGAGRAGAGRAAGGRAGAAVPLPPPPPGLAQDLAYKPPKRFTNASWITKRLYKFLESKLEPKYDYKARVRAERLVRSLFDFASVVRRAPAAPDALAALRREMARVGVVTTHADFYDFFHEFMPREVRVKVVPDIHNKLPIPRQGVCSNILKDAVDQR